MPPGSVIVSLVGPPPLLSPVERQRLGDRLPAIIAFCPGSLPERVNLAVLFDQGLLQAAVVSRPNPKSSAAKSGSLQAWFDQAFAGITTSADATAIALRSEASQSQKSPP